MGNGLPSTPREWARSAANKKRWAYSATNGGDECTAWRFRDLSDMGHSMRPVEQEQRERKRKGLRISDRRREKSKKPEGCPKRGPRWDLGWDLDPRGYEQEIGEAMSAQRGAWRCMKDESDELMSAQRGEWL
jgi:hypothetical protein